MMEKILVENPGVLLWGEGERYGGNQELICLPSRIHQTFTNQRESVMKKADNNYGSKNAVAGSLLETWRGCSREPVKSDSTIVQ